MGDQVSVKVNGVYVVEAEGGFAAPVVLLEDEAYRIVPIFVGLSEAISIHKALSGETSPRPTTHDLFISALECLNAEITDVLIDDLDGGIYYARLSVSIDSVGREIDARPSDCLALALRADTPIQIRENVVLESCVDRNELENLKDIENYL